MIEGLQAAIGFLFEWPNPAWVVGGVLFGMLIGFLPGMAGSVALALLIPVSFTLGPELAVLFLIGAYSPAGFGGMITSILLNTPGAPENAATTFDGYPMTKQGRAGAALGAATAASVAGGLIGTAVLVAIIPLAQRFVLAFSYPEFLMIAVLGLTVIAVVTERSTLKGLLAGGAGFLLAFIGLDPITGSPRFTFGQIYLWDGIDIVPVLIGLFAGAEILSLFGRGVTIAQSIPNRGDTRQAEAAPGGSRGPVTFWEGVRSTFRHWFLVVRASLIGTVIGIIPGVGGAVSGFLAYSHAKQTAKNPDEFGKGEVQGVIAAESANDAKEGGSLVPTVAFGIPGTVGMAILLGALVLHGVPAGPTLLLEHANLIYILLVGMVASKFVAPVVVWLVAKHAVRLTTLRPGIITPLIAVAALVGTFTVHVDILDVVVVLVFSYIGYAMRRYGFSRVALIIALVLGVLVERSYYQTVTTFGSAWPVIERPIAATLTALSIVVLLYAAVQGLRSRRDAREIADDDEEAPVDGRQPGRLFFDALLLALGITIVVSAASLDTDAGTMPMLLGVPFTVGAALLLGYDTVRAVRQPEVARRDGSDREVLRRQAAFAAWAVMFVALSWIVGFTVSIPIALLFFLLVLAREPLLKSLALTAGSWLFIYGLFELGLGVSLS